VKELLRVENINYQPIEPRLIKLEGEYGFIIATEIDISNIENGVMLFRGNGFGYDDGILTTKNRMEIQFGVEEDQHHLLDDKGNAIDY